MLKDQKYQNEIINEFIILSEGDCDEEEFMTKFQQSVATEPIARHMNNLLQWRRGSVRTDILKEFTSIQKLIKDWEKKIKIEYKNGDNYDDSDIFNNKQRNINIQNKLIYIIRYKYNLFLSILFVIGLICNI